MLYRKCGDTYLVRIDCGEEVMEQLKLFCEKEDIGLAQVSGLGGADHAVIGVYDLAAQAYHREELDRFMEILDLTGNVTRVDGAPYIHLHAVMADQQNALHGGHVISIRIGATCELFVRPLPGELGRVRDEGLGINIWDMATVQS